VCGLELGVIPVLRPVAVGRRVDVGAKRGVLELVTGVVVVVGVEMAVLEVETGVVVDADVLDGLEEELVEELVESSPAAKSFGPGIS
jgi:serine acetyltransferase